MGVSSVGLQIVMPNTGTSPHTQPQQQSNDRDRREQENEPRQSSPSSGVGKLVDKVV